MKLQIEQKNTSNKIKIHAESIKYINLIIKIITV